MEIVGFVIAMETSQKRYQIPAEFQDSLQGLRIFSIRNSRSAYVIPSTENYFDGYKVGHVKIDPGASVSVLPVASPEDLELIFGRYPPPLFKFDVLTLKTFGGSALAFSVQSSPVDSNSNPVFNGFDIYLGADVFPGVANETDEGSPNSPRSTLVLRSCPSYTADRLCFFLCSEDVETIRKSDRFRGRFLPSDLCILDQFDREAVLRRDDAIIGAPVLQQMGFSSIEHNCIELFFEVSKHPLHTLDWATVHTITRDVHSRKYIYMDPSGRLDWILPNDIIGRAE